MTELWHGRSALRLTNGLVEAVFLPGGGHVAEFSFTTTSKCPQQNVIWQPSWRTADPYSDEYASLARQYGDIDTGRFLASYSGHALCLDGFGLPSRTESRSGIGLHGEAAITPWKFGVEETKHGASAVAELSRTRLRVERGIRLYPNESILRVDEWVHNLSKSQRALHWVQHATFGTPFFSPGISNINASVTHGITWPYGYDGHALLPDNTEFTWPHVPTLQGGRINLREPFSLPGYGFVVAAQQDQSRAISFIAALNRSQGIAAGYCYRADIFPWLTIWEENRTRTNHPWDGRSQVRGMEFGTTPLPLGRDEIEQRGSLFGQPTARNIGSMCVLHAPWLLFLAIVPSSWHSIEDVRIEHDAILLLAGKERVKLSALGVVPFLEGQNTQTT